MNVAPGNRQTPNQYLVDLITDKRQTPIKLSDPRIKPLIRIIKNWGGKQLAKLFVSGSSAKKTGLKGSSDLDLFISLKSNTKGTLEEIYTSFYSFVKKNGYSVRKQNVSVRALIKGLQIDLVPGKRLPKQQDWHFLYTNRRPDQHRIQTNVNKHVRTIIKSGRINEIIALKIWRDRNKIDFPSMYLEMYVLRVLNKKHKRKSLLADNVLYVIEHIANYFHSTAIYDPANTQNVISNSLTKSEKNAIQRAAEKSISKSYLSEIIY